MQEGLLWTFQALLLRSWMVLISYTLSPSPITSAVDLNSSHLTCSAFSSCLSGGFSPGVPAFPSYFSCGGGSHTPPLVPPKSPLLWLLLSTFVPGRALMGGGTGSLLPGRTEGDSCHHTGISPCQRCSATQRWFKSSQALRTVVPSLTLNPFQDRHGTTNQWTEGWMDE